MKCRTVCSRQQPYWTGNSVCARKSEFSSGVFSHTSKKKNSNLNVEMPPLGYVFGDERILRTGSEWEQYLDAQDSRIALHCTALLTEPRNNNAALPSSWGAEITVVELDTFEDQPQRKSFKILTAVQVKNTSSFTTPGLQIKGCQKWAAADKENSSGEQLAAALSHSWDSI